MGILLPVRSSQSTGAGSCGREPFARTGSPRLLAAVLIDGTEAVEAAIREALDAGAASDEVILNILARYRERASERPLDVVVDLKRNSTADCGLRALRHGARPRCSGMR